MKSLVEISRDAVLSLYETRISHYRNVCTKYIAHFECNRMNKSTIAELRHLEQKLKATLIMSVSESVTAGAVLVPPIWQDIARVRLGGGRLVDCDETERKNGEERVQEGSQGVLWGCQTSVVGRKKFCLCGEDGGGVEDAGGHRGGRR